MMPALPIEGYDTTREDGVTRIRPVYAAPLPVEAVAVQGQGLIPQETPALPVELPVERSGGILADADRALSGAVRAPFDALDERLFGKSGKKGTYREAIQKFFKTGPSDEVKTGVNRLLGTGGEERYKTWPEKLVVDAVTAPGNVLKSETPVTTEELIKPALDVSNLAGTGGLASVGVHGRNPNILGIVPVGEAKSLNVKASPASELLQNIVKNTDGASIDADGHLIVNMKRNQKPEQELSESVRGGVFYLPRGSKYARHYNDTTGNVYGGRQTVEGETAYLNPLVVKGQTGGKMPENAYNQLMGDKKAYSVMEKDAMSAVHGSIYNKHDPQTHRLLVEQFLEKHAPEMKYYADFIIGNSKKGSQLRYALTEAAVASAARKAGYDGLIGYSTKKDGTPFMSEIFDVRENAYPSPNGHYSVHDMFLKSDNQPSVGIGAVSKAEKPFYSALERSLGSINQNKASGEQWLGMLANKGVKPDELQWSGVSEFLAGKPSVTKAELDNFLKENAFGVQEVVKGANIPTKYHDYQLPGGENYRELLMTLPSKKVTEITPEQFRAGAIRLYGEKYADSLSQAQQEIVRRNLRGEHDGTTANDYRSSHWDEPNILAHMRMNDRTIDGKKSLHLEEIQSDWHQAGRKQGYKGEGLPKTDPRPELEKATAVLNDIDKNYPYDGSVGYKTYVNSLPAEIKAKHDKAQSDIAKLTPEVESYEKMLRGASDKVPDAPFKKNWHELALKRAIREAAENGYERLSWTPGEAQAARYDLSKQVDQIKYLKNDDGTYNIVPFKNNAPMHAIEREAVSADKLADIVGKEVAEKIIKDQGKREGKDIGVLEGADLKIGGEGMKGFYDNIVPKTIEKLGKQFGVKVKVHGVTLEDATKQLKNFEKSLNSKPMNAEQKREWNRLRDQIGDAKNGKIYYIDIPPAMRDKVLAEGFPLFSANVPVIDNDQTR